MNATDRLQQAIDNEEQRIRRANARIDHKESTGAATPAQAERSRRVTIGRMQARVDFLQRELDRHEKQMERSWKAAQALHQATKETS